MNPIFYGLYQMNKKNMKTQKEEDDEQESFEEITQKKCYKNIIKIFIGAIIIVVILGCL